MALKLPKKEKLKGGSFNLYLNGTNKEYFETTMSENKQEKSDVINMILRVVRENETVFNQLLESM